MMKGNELNPLPAFDAGARIAVVAGSGVLPLEVVEKLVLAGHRPLVVAMEGEIDPALFSNSTIAKNACDIWQTPIERIALLIPRLKRAGVTHLVLAGGVGRRPPLHKLRLGFDTLVALPRIALAYARGDDGLLRAVIAYVESKGIKIIGAHEIVPDLLAPEGVMTDARPRPADYRDIEAAHVAAHTIGALDIGQAAIAIGGRAVALEGIEGTEGLLARAKALRSHGRLAGKARGVLVKCAKPQQELRADLPAIGPDTIDAAHDAGLAGVAVEAGHALILDYAATIKRANEKKLFVLGLAGKER